MNTANKLTFVRVILVPVFLFFLYMNAIPLNFLWALIVFCAASLTDYFDGKIARERGMITDFGKFLDPLADKILVMAAVVAFVGFGLAHPIAVILIIAREFMVSGIRMLAASGEGKVIAANWWGKVKTTLQMFAIIAVLALFELARIVESAKLMLFTYDFSNIVMWVVSAFTVVSGVVYLKENWSIVTRDR